MVGYRMDSEAIVKGLIAEYVKPKYPIYKVCYTAVFIPDGCLELVTRRKSKIVEVIPETNENVEDGHFENNQIYESCVHFYNKSGIVQIEATEYDREIFGEFDPTELIYIIYKMERLA